MHSDSMHSDKLSILFGTVDRAESAFRLIQSIEAFTPPVDYEIIVVDGSVTKSVLDFVMQRKKIIYLEDLDRKGFSHAYNMGATLATGNFIVWLNDDCEVTPGWATGALSFMNALPRAGVGGLCFNENGRHAIKQTIFSRYVANFGFIRTRLWTKLNGLDERFPSYGSETDLCLRVLEANYCVLPVPDVCINHYRVYDQHHKYMVEKHRPGSFSLFKKLWTKNRLQAIDLRRML